MLSFFFPYCFLIAEFQKGLAPILWLIPTRQLYLIAVKPVVLPAIRHWWTNYISPLL